MFWMRGIEAKVEIENVSICPPRRTALIHKFDTHSDFLLCCNFSSEFKTDLLAVSKRQAETSSNLTEASASGRSEKTASDSGQAGEVEWTKSLKGFPMSTKKQIKNHKDKSGKLEISTNKLGKPIHKTLKRCLKFKEERCLKADSVYVKIKMSCQYEQEGNSQPESNF